MTTTKLGLEGFQGVGESRSRYAWISIGTANEINFAPLAIGETL